MAKGTFVQKVPANAAKVSGPGGGRGLKAQGVASGKGVGFTGTTLSPNNAGQGTKTYKGVQTKAQVTGTKRGGSRSKTGGNIGAVKKG